jgi:hypothetical protein
MAKKLIFLLFPLAVLAQPGNYTCIWHTTGNDVYSCLGMSLVSAGDINDDGYDDILASSDSVVYLYLGGNPMDTIPDLIFEVPRDYSYPTLPRECLDLNGDGYPDFTILGDSLGYNSMYLFFGGPNMDNQPDLIFHCDSTGYFQNFYGDYSSMGDFNGNGYYDLVVANGSYWPPMDLGNGKIYVYYGGPDIDNIPDWTVTGYYNSYGSLGVFISSSGDVNNDGYDDILCRGISDSNGEGIVLFHGGTCPDTTVDWETQHYNDFWDGGISIIPDFNADGYDEISYGAPVGCGAYIFYGSSNIGQQWDIHLIGLGNSTTSCVYIGDVNCDSWGDYATSEMNDDIINIFFLHPGISGIAYQDISIQIDNPLDVKYAGDVNGDSVDDFILNTWYNHFGYNWQGKIFIYSDTSLSSVKPNIGLSIPSFTLYQNSPNPFNNKTNIEFSINTDDVIKVSIYDILGYKVAELLNEKVLIGNYRIQWKANNFPSGIYFLEITDGKYRETKAMQLLK